jgi:hypothetical protein
MPWLCQLAIFTIIIATCNKAWYKEESIHEDGTITSDQSLTIIAAGFAGMFLLIPLPYMSQIIRLPSLLA